MAKVDVEALGAALDEVQRVGLPVQSVDIHSGGRFTIICGFNPVDWARLELEKVDNRYLFPTDQEFRSMRPFVEKCLKQMASDLDCSDVVVLRP